TGRYWAITIFGYCLNLLAVPLLALTGSWEAAAVLIIVERMGRALRGPPPAPRAPTPFPPPAVSHTGLGWGFGLHEALDQVGAVLGPLIIAAVIAFEGGYRTGFAVVAGAAG